MKTSYKYRWLVLICIFLGCLHTMAHPVSAQAQRTWQPANSMNTARTGVTAVVLNDQICVMGGEDVNGLILDIVECYRPESNTWHSAPSLRTPRYNAAAILYDEKVFLMGGHDSDGEASKKVDVYLPTENRWESYDNLNEEREGLAAVVLDEQLYVIGGSNGSGNFLNTVEVLDSMEEDWEYYTDWELDVPRALFGYTILEDVAYIVGGYSSFGPMGLFQVYDESDGNSDLNELAPGRGGLKAVTLENSIYAIGGRTSDNRVVASVDRYLFENNRWEEAPRLGTARERFAAVTYEGKIYVFGGNTADGEVLSSVEVFTNVVVPSVVDDVLVTNEDENMSVNVLINDSDPEGAPLSISSFSQPLHGEVTQTSASTLTYTPAKDFFGEDQFSYTALNLSGGTARGLVNITVLPINDQPVFSSAPVKGAAQNSVYSYNITATDIDNDVLTFSAEALPTWLNFADQGNGRALLEGTPGEAEQGDHTVLLSVTDGVASSEQNFSITVVDGVPGQVILLSPDNEAKNLPLNQSLSWISPGAAGYDLEVSLDGSFQDLVISASDLTQTTYFLKDLVQNTTYYWRVMGFNAAGSTEWSEPHSFTTVNSTAVKHEMTEVNLTRLLNYPNPFQHRTWLVLELERPGSIMLDIYDVRGSLIKNVVSGQLTTGVYQYLWEGLNDAGREVASGVYLVKLTMEDKTESRTILKMR